MTDTTNIAAVTGAAAELQRLQAEHAHRVTLQHHAADMAEEMRPMTAERDAMASHERACPTMQAAPSAGHNMSDAAALIAAQAAEIERLRARLAEIELAEPVAWIEHELQGTGARHLHSERRPYCLRDDVIAPVWTALIARPEPTSDHCEDAIEMAPARRLLLADGCEACGDACRSRGSCRLADESPEIVPAPTFRRGDIVRKRSGSQWHGRVVGEYSTALTQEGYAIESDAHHGSVQIYPVAALELVARNELMALTGPNA